MDTTFMFFVFALLYLWSGITLLMALIHIEHISAAINELGFTSGMRPLGPYGLQKRGVQAIIIALWPAAVFIWWHAAKEPM